MKHGLLFNLALKRQLAIKLAEKGKSAKEVRSLLTDVTPDLVEATCAALPTVTKAMAELDKAGAIGDGSIIKQLILFFQSEAGQALLQALISLLIGLI